MGTTNGVMWRRLRYMLTPQFDIYKHLADRLKTKGVLEVGFGTGFGVLQYAHVASWVDAIEPDPEAVEFARCSYPCLRVEWMEADITAFYTPARYGAIVMVEVLEHIENWGAALDNCASLLQTDGTLYVSGPNSNANLRKNDEHEREWTAEEFFSALNERFSKVWLMDYRLEDVLPVNTKRTPLVAVARK